MVYMLTSGREHRSKVEVLEYMEPLAVPRPLSFVNCSSHPEEPDTHRAYRRRMREKWRVDSPGPQWSRRQPPTWRDDDAD
jgi:hypothetical protein